ncbi:hypothetical protein GYMLUDRAFT_165051 [Collybiopsis luxurians FD-317 M1]|uniref:Microbial-type PARG catalytic domain-containing protein n=1 Tax=Collybiopsis luxurians FD-317 M1 TaxID=944289 RepID=A0A0D0CZZ8_9AGAR|nr:hypothetical protein GYMLUDRAFT_165051 [Collybiopsis luxurians FD-317 M1]
MFTSIVSEHASEGASARSQFISQQLPPLKPSERPYIDLKRTSVEVFNGDTLVIARRLMETVGEHAEGKTAVLNLASDQYPGGGWEAGYLDAQEPYLCYSSTLFHSLTQPNIIPYYPWPNTGPGCVAGIFSEGVVVFRGPLDMIKARSVLGSSDDSLSSSVQRHNLEFSPILPPTSRKVLSVISVAAPRYPGLTLDGNDFADEEVKEEVKEKVRLVLRMAALHGKRYLVLGAMGCGTYLCPPVSIAKLMKSVLLEKEFQGWFARIIFAILSPNGIGYSNFEIFRNVLAGVEV